jgi:hypothetical protein
MKPRLIRDERGFANIPESYPQNANCKRPTKLNPTENETSFVYFESFQQLLDGLRDNDPSSDVNMSNVKNFAAEFAASNSKIDPSRLSREIDNSYGIGDSQQFLSQESLGFSINHFRSSVDIGDLETNREANDKDWQETISNLIPLAEDPNGYHKEYKVSESNETKRMTSNDWEIEYSTNTQNFTPMHEASSQLTNNILTYVTLNDVNRNGNLDEGEHLIPCINRPPPLSEEKRQFSVDIKRTSIGIDDQGRLGCYESVTTNLLINTLGYNLTNNMSLNNEPFLQHQYNDGYYANNPEEYRYLEYSNPLANEKIHDGHQMNNYTTPQAVGLFQHQKGEEHLPSFQHTTQSFTPGDAPAPKRQSNLKSEMDDRVVDPTESDVLLERGGKGNHHKGSRYYRRLINENRDAYKALPDTSRAEKMAISLNVVMSLKETGARFIHKKNGKYVVMSDREARNKISQALREKKERVMVP